MDDCTRTDLINTHDPNLGQCLQGFQKAEGIDETASNKWMTNLSSLDDREFEEFLNHAEKCQYHARILNEYESEALPFIKLAFSDSSKKHGVSTLPEMPFHNYKGTSFTSTPLRHKPKGRSIEEEIISEKVREIFKTGVTLENNQRCLEMLEKNSSIVQHSWTNTLNKARVLLGLEEKKEAERILLYVMEKYSSSREAVGSVYEVFAWLEELKYNEGYKANRKTLDRRVDYINKGLKFYPENYMLWINAFETACLKNYVDEAISYLKKLEKIDNQIARRYLLDSSIKPEIGKSDIRLKKEIIRLSPEVEREII
jgi:tetratricopeptide (TPR) repeat protein